jgi:hypothetical protein
MTMWGDSLKKHNWKCPHPGCIYEAIMYGESSLKVAKELHLANHENNDRIALAEFRKLVPVVKDYDKLELTATDRAFLRTRGIKAD